MTTTTRPAVVQLLLPLSQGSSSVTVLTTMVTKDDDISNKNNDGFTMITTNDDNNDETAETPHLPRPSVAGPKKTAGTTAVMKAAKFPIMVSCSVSFCTSAALSLSAWLPACCPHGSRTSMEGSPFLDRSRGCLEVARGEERGARGRVGREGEGGGVGGGEGVGGGGVVMGRLGAVYYSRCLLAVSRSRNRLVYLRDGSAQMIAR